MKILATLVCLAPVAAHAQIVELSQSDLRAAIANDSVIPTRQMIAGVENFTGGDVMDVRVFLVDGTITYRILVSYGDGQLGSILVDGVRGTQIAQSSNIGSQVMAAAASGRNPNSVNANNGNNGNNGNGNNGNGNGNSGNGNNGNGNGNSGNGNNGNGNGNNK
ncbi:hypothetical protein [Yoonia tamlensis]|uniref:hypothetical protein n=1 Tax=Yoonia tamlensis TaxID=390270 RepID=UPI001041D716|nr:hypothetical protein [Yoonia tamlensis]